MINGVQILIEQINVDHILSISGHPSWSFLIIQTVEPYSQLELKTLFLQEIFARGILTLGSHNMSYMHSDNDINQLLTAYKEIFTILKEVVDNKSLKHYLRCAPLEPLFKVR